jgi:hypothetical protein
MTAKTNWGILAEFDSAAAIYEAAEKTTQQGYTRVDAHTPFPVNGLEKALRQGPSALGWIVVLCGITGIAIAQGMMWWMNGVDYPFWVSGKQPYAWPSTIPRSGCSLNSCSAHMPRINFKSNCRHELQNHF